MKKKQHDIKPRELEFIIGKSDRLQVDGANLASSSLEEFSPSLAPMVVDGTVDLVAFANILEAEGEDLGIKILDKFGPSEKPSTLVVAMEIERAEHLKKVTKNHLVIEKNEPLEMFQGELPGDFDNTDTFPASEPNSEFNPQEDEFSVKITVREKGSSGKFVSGAMVYLIGETWPAKGVTDEKGEVKLDLFGETNKTLRTLIIKPRDRYWSLWIENPDIKKDQNNIIHLKRLNEHPSLSNFPKTERYGWGQLAMQLDKVRQPEKPGEGVRIAIIDSGLDTEHKDLQGINIKEGVDFTGEGRQPEKWNHDKVGHGSHVAGVIASQANEKGIRGFATAADIYVYKVFPGGKISSLIKSIDQCIQNKVDVVNLSLGSRTRSELLHQKVREARSHGVACIAAAGNSKGPVMYPAKFPEVLAVAAIGEKESFPDDSYHKRQEGEYSNGKYFSARFTCFGPEIDVCAPGVAIVSTVPTSELGFASWDGTSMACPHVVGLAALILQKKKNISVIEGSKRVDTLFSYIKEKVNKLPQIPEKYRGAGIPNIQKAISGSQTNGGTATDPWHKVSELLEEAIVIIKSQVP
ncbi:MAG: S8 family peptidase [Nitrospiria bacterium]